MHVTYFHAGQLTTVNAKAVIMCVPKYISSRLITEIPVEQKAAMRHTRYAPIPGGQHHLRQARLQSRLRQLSFTDFIVADWTVRNQPGYQQKNNILTFYTPLRENQRYTLLQEEGCKLLAARVLADFQKTLPEFNVTPR